MVGINMITAFHMLIAMQGFTVGLLIIGLLIPHALDRGMSMKSAHLILNARIINSAGIQISNLDKPTQKLV